MKHTKKVLSVFLAVVMIMSSMSVCFGSFTFKASAATVSADDVKTLLGKVSNLTDYTTGDGTLIKAADAIYTYAKENAVPGTATHNQNYSSPAFTKIIYGNSNVDLYNMAVAAVNNSSYNSLIAAVIPTSGVTDDSNASYNSNTAASASHNITSGVTKTATFKADFCNTLKTYTSVSSLPDSIVTSVTYSYVHGYGQHSAKGSGFIVYKWKSWSYHCFENTNAFSRSETTTATNKSVLEAMATALKNNSAFLSKGTIEGILEVTKDPTTLNNAANALETAYNNVANTFSGNASTLFNHFFNNTASSDNAGISYSAVTPLVKLLREAAIVAEYKTPSETIKTSYEKYSSGEYKNYTSTEVNELYNTLKTAYDDFKKADDSYEATIAQYYGIADIIGDVWVDANGNGEVDMDTDTGALPTLLAYYFEIFLTSIHERAIGTDSSAGYIETYNKWTVVDIDNDVITSADILKALNEVTLDIDTITKDATDEAIQEWFSMSKNDLITKLTAVKTHLEELGYYAGLNDELYAQYKTFTNNIVGVINADSEKLYSVLSGYESWRKNLDSFFTTWTEEVGEYADLLEDGLQEEMNTYMREAYTALKARVETQIDTAYGLYEVYSAHYGDIVNMASISSFNTLRKAIDSIEHNAYNWMLTNHEDHYGPAIGQDSIDKYAALQHIYGQYSTFAANRGFDTYEQTFVNTVREDTADDIARENADTDNDETGEYEVTDENVQNIIDLLESALKDETVKKLLGNLINKDEDGNPTGEAFDLAALVTGLLEDNLYTDNLINTILQFLYPIIAQAFLDVWEGLPPSVETSLDTGIDLVGEANVFAYLDLYDVDTAIYNVGIALSPYTLGQMLASNSTYASKYSKVISTLTSVTAKTRYDMDGNYVDPWKDSGLFKEVTDEKTGETKSVYSLDWGIDSATDKRAAFIDAACAALSGLEPLLYPLLLNQKFVNTDTTPDSDARGCKIGTSGSGSTASYSALSGDMISVLTLDPITLYFEVSANDGYDNVLAPLFELLGLENIPHSEDMKTTRDFLEKGLFAMIDQLIAKLAANPIETILDIVPNLIYALEADLIAPILNLLEIEIYYEADAAYSAAKPNTSGLSWDSIVGSLAGALASFPITGVAAAAMKADKPIVINVGEMLDLESMGLNLSGGLAGILEMVGIDIPLPDVSVLATAGVLQWPESNRSERTYSYGEAGKAAHIKANRADVLEYLVKYVLENLQALLKAFDVDVNSMGEVVTTILNNVSTNANDSVAGIVELFNQKVYNTLETYNWYTDGFTPAEDADIDFTPATEIYLNPANDWTDEKADYLYENLEAIVGAVLTMAKVDLDKDTAELDTSLEDLVSGLVNGLFTNETVTSLAKLLGALDLNTTLNKDKTEEEKAAALDVNGLIKNFLGVDLSVYAQYANLKEDDVLDFGVTDAASFVDAIVTLLTPLESVLDFILAGGNIEATFAKGTENEDKLTLIGYDGYNNAIIPLLEALGCTVPASTSNSLDVLRATLNAIIAKVDSLTTNTEENAKDGLIYGVIDMLPGILYFLSSDGVTTTVRNLLQPVYVILDTIRPIYDLDLADLVANIQVDLDKDGVKTPLGLDLENLSTAGLLDFAQNLVGLDLSELQVLIYDVCEVLGVEYNSTSTLQTNWKRGAYNENFDQSDMLTVVLSFLLEWVTVKENAEALDKMLGTDGLVAAISTVFEDVEISYGTPDWMYWFESEEEFNAYVNGNAVLPNTLLALDYPNDWDEATAQYVAKNLAAIVEEIIPLIEINGVKYESLSALLNSLIASYISADTINDLLDMLKDVLANIDDTLLGAGYILDVDLVGLKNYTCTKEISTISEFAAELAYILDTFAPALVDLLFFGDDIRIAKKSDKTDTIVINGGLGYEKGLALILEALGCEVPAAAEATTANVLGALATRIEYILADGNTVNAIIDLLPNLIYFLNANGLGVAVDNILKPVYVLVDKINALGILENEINIADLIKIKVTEDDGTEKEIKLNLAALSLEYLVNLVEELTGLDLVVVEEMLVDFCLGKIEKGSYTYKMVADREDVITLVLTVALLVVETEGNDKVLNELIGSDLITSIKDIISGANVTYVAPEWDYALAGDNALIDYAITYPNNWNEATASYVAENLDEIVDGVIALIEINGVKYDSVSALLGSMVNIYTADNLKAIQKLLADLIGGLDEDLKDLVNIALGAADALLDADVNGLINYDVSAVNNKATFIDALTGMLMEVEGLVDWLLLGEDYEFFVDDDGDMDYEDGEAIVTLTGANGYAEGLALLLEALGCDTTGTIVYTDGVIDTEATVKAVLTSVANRIDEILANPVEEVVELLPNLFYFLNTNGLAAVIDNTIAAIMALVDKLAVFDVKLDLNELVNLAEILKIEDKYAENETKISLDNLAMSDILKAVSLMTNLDITMLEEVLVGFALGQVTTYTSVSTQAGEPKKMTYKSEFDKHDMLTVVATLAILTLVDEENKEVVTELLGEDVYQTIINVLNMNLFVPEMQEMSWILTEYADTNEAVSGMETSELFEGWGYGPLYTEEMAQYIADNFGRFLDNILFLLGIEINGVQVESLQEIIDELMDGTLYTTDTINTILDLLRKIPSFITDFAGANMTKHVNAILKNSIGVDLTYWDTYVPNEVTSRDEFVAELCRMLQPFYPVLKWLLADEDFAFFVDGANEGDDMIVLYGAEGYTYGIAPILEALQCENVVSGADYLKVVAEDDSAILTSILNPLLDKVDTILNAEENGSTIADEVLALLPSIIYFINSNGLDTSVKNILNAVYTVLNAIEPVTGEINLYDLIGLNLENLTFEELFDLVIEMIGDAVGYDLSAITADFVAELTTGYVVTYRTASGDIAYTMVYAEEESGSAADMVTVILRLALTFLACEDNQEKVLAILAEQFNMNEDAQEYLAGVFEAIADCEIGTYLGMDKACAVIYYLFYSADIGADFVATGIKDLNAEWRGVLEELGKTEAGTDPTVGNLISRFLDVTMKDILDDVLDSDGVASNGFISFFQRIIEWFKSIFAWFQNLFA